MEEGGRSLSIATTARYKNPHVVLPLQVTINFLHHFFMSSHRPIVPHSDLRLADGGQGDDLAWRAANLHVVPHCRYCMLQLISCIMFVMSSRIVPHSDLRLADGYRVEEGRVELYHQGEWGTICATGFGWDDGTVVCRQLGFFGLKTYYSSAEQFGEGTGPILGSIQCEGTEASLYECELGGWDTQGCSHAQDVGIVCVKGG